MTATCLRCNKPLSLAESVMRGMGAICAEKKQTQLADEGVIDKIDLPFDPVAKDIICQRRADGLHFNIFQVFRHHSPGGMEWGYEGSGPADFALNILEIFMREAGERPKLKIARGSKVTMRAWQLHHEFKRTFIARIPSYGGVLKGEDIRRWIKAAG